MLLLALLLTVLVPAGGIAALVHFGAKHAKSRARLQAERRLLAAPAELVDGAHVSLSGIVEVLEPLLAPITERPCVAWHVKAFFGPHWMAHFRMRAFIVRTEHGPVIVDQAAEAGLDVPPLHVRPPLEVAARFFGAFGRGWQDAAGARFEETAVLPGMAIVISGVVMTELAAPASELGFRDTHRILRLRSTPAFPLTIGERRKR